MCTSRRSVSSSALVAQSFFTSARLFTSMPRSTRRRRYMHQHLPQLSSLPFAPVDLQALPTVESFLPPLVPPAVNQAAPPPSLGAGIVPLVADCLTQLSGGLIITPATISSPAAVPALHRLVSTPDAQLATLVPTVPVTRFASLRLFATCSLDIALRLPSSRTTIVAALASAEPPGGARSPSSSTPVAAGLASAGPAAPAVVPVACLDPYHDFEIQVGRLLVTAWAGLALMSRAVREDIFRPRSSRDNKSIP